MTGSNRSFRLTRAENSDRIFQEIVDELLARLQAGEGVQLSQYVDEHPEYAARLSLVWPAMQVLASVAQSRVDVESLAPLPHEPVPMEGTLGDFRLLREVGRGGMGIVYEAEQISLGRHVALKILPFAETLDERQLHRFKNESRAAAGLHHTNIVPVFSVGCERGVHYYAMQYIDGCTLADVIGEFRRRGEQKSGTTQGDVVDEETSPVALFTTIRDRSSKEYIWRIAELGTQVAEALEYAHQRGVVHRDVKPSNLLIDHRGNVWVTDFGLAQMDQDSAITMTGDILGTLRYMSPEQALGDRSRVDERADVYSFGVTLYELLCLKSPFEADTRGEMLRRITSGEAIRPCLANNEIPGELELVLLKAIACDPEDRYTSAQELADDLRRFREHRPIRARRPTLRERLQKWVRRNRRTVSTATVAILAALLGLVLVFDARRTTRYEQQLRYQQGLLLSAQEEAVRLNRYLLNVNRAAQAVNSADLVKARDNLTTCIPKAGESDLRGWEWNFLSQWCDGQYPPIGRHLGPAYTMAFSPDGFLLATGGQDGARVWEYSRGEQLVWLQAHTRGVSGVGFSVDGKLLATAGEDGQLLLWSTTTWSLQHRLDMHEPISGMEFSADGSLLVVVVLDPQHPREEPATSRHVVKFLSTQTWEPIWEIDDELVVRGGRLSPDGTKLVLVADDSYVRVWDLASRQRLVTHRDGYTSGPGCAVISPHQSRAFVGTINGNLVRIDWDSSGNVQSYPWNAHEGHIRTLSMSSDGKNLVSASPNVNGDRRVHVWDLSQLSDGVPTTALVMRAESPLWCVRPAPDAKTFAAVSDEGVVRKWDMNPVVFERRIHIPDYLTSLWFSNDGQSLFTTGSFGIARYDVRTGRCLKRFSGTGGDIGSAVVSKDRRWIAGIMFDSALEVFDVSDRSVFYYPVAALAQHDSDLPTRLLCTAFSGDGNLLGIATGPSHTIAGSLMFFSLKENPVVRVPAPVPNLTFATAVGFSPDNKWIAVQNVRNLQVWSLGTHRLEYEDSERAFFTFSPNSRLFASSGLDGTIQIRRTDDWSELSTFPAEVHSQLIFAPDGQTIATANLTGPVRLWHCATGRQVFAFDSRMSSNGPIAFAPHGEAFAVTGKSQGGEQEVRIWCVAPNAKRPANGGLVP